MNMPEIFYHEYIEDLKKCKKWQYFKRRKLKKSIAWLEKKYTKEWLINEYNRKEGILRDFTKKMSKQESIPQEFVAIVNKRFWDLF